MQSEKLQLCSRQWLCSGNTVSSVTVPVANVVHCEVQGLSYYKLKFGHISETICILAKPAFAPNIRQQ